MAKKSKKAPMPVVPFRLPVDLVARLDERAACLARKTPGLQVTRADALRVLLTRALDESSKETE
jgi:hypothetical protein